MPLLTTTKILQDIEKYGALGMYVPPEGGYEGRFQRLLRNSGYEVLFITARGLGDVAAYLTGIHGVRPPHLGKQPGPPNVRRYFLPPKIQYRLANLSPKSKGLLVWLIEGKFLSRQEWQVIANIPQQDSRVKIVLEVGSGREVYWKPLAELVQQAA
ncbi:MAG: NAD(P)H-quinone oxidoreductase subunit N [Pseudanabaenaceae cyanobacterium SKYGB_i_bin29]|nr:NAD(P)H-quinone oxidoreductase subunit N [Pseudanabaenaceae cyanobacterium SKYG29]MDW8420887.1 NAD(P)H-quinone oxidoreductase subunit N [Pseudanabaenaceae cyanobacterium SKYGB_i_bin29]